MNVMLSLQGHGSKSWQIAQTRTWGSGGLLRMYSRSILCLLRQRRCRRHVGLCLLNCRGCMTIIRLRLRLRLLLLLLRSGLFLMRLSWRLSG